MTIIYQITNTFKINLIISQSYYNYQFKCKKQGKYSKMNHQPNPHPDQDLKDNNPFRNRRIKKNISKKLIKKRN